MALADRCMAQLADADIPVIAPIYKPA